jgi:signal transduction histidine kinase
VERRSGAIVEVGARAPDALGLDRSTLLSTPFPDLALHLELPRPDLQARQDRWVGDRAYDVFASGRVVGDVDLVLVVFHDVTERLLRAEELDALAHDLAVARDQALAADRTKTAFLAGMSHELRTPLTAILGYAELLADDLDDPSWLADLGRITTAGTHLLRLVDEVLDLARVESGEVALAMEAFPVGPLLEEVADSVRLRAAAGGKEIAVEVVDDLCLWGDRQRVLQVMLNLVVNAVKYAVPGRVLVGVERGVEGRWALFVEDEGPGLTPQQQVRIFHAFRQLHDVSDGVGLGLAISRRLAEAMGGDLTVASTPDGGSRFRLWLDAPEASRLEPRGLDRVNRSRRSDTPRPSQEVPHGPHVGIGSR